MCGVAGILNISSLNKEKLESHTRGMTNSIQNRGPDSDGIWIDDKAFVSLGHRRLSIIDLSENGHQPMISHSGRYVITYNGEIYNYRDLQSDLEAKGVQFKGHSDTEVLLAAVEAWGLEKTLSKLNGMFALALWDNKEKELFLARDRMGKKPLYYTRCDDGFVFASELKAMRSLDGFSAEICKDAVCTYLRHNYIPAPYSIYEGVYKLPPASFMKVTARDTIPTEPQYYWDLKAVSQSGDIDFSSYEDVCEQVEECLEQAVKMRMISDVPFGSFLSGGIDSSLITALMQKHSSSPVKTFCIGFEGAGYNEAPYAKKIAEHLGTEHHEYFVTDKEAREIIPDLPKIYDEPFADPSQIPTYHVSKIARQEVTVALSGDGGDEGFAGYARYHQLASLLNRKEKIPQAVAVIASRALGILPGQGKVAKIAAILGSKSDADMYKNNLSYWQNPEMLVLSAQEKATHMNSFSNLPSFEYAMDMMMYMDMQAYLPDDILAKVDRASMAVSLETRAPLLDYKLIELAWKIPLRHKIDRGSGKKPLKSILEKYVPKEHFDRPKQGFGIPHGQWIKGPLKDWAEDMLAVEKIKDQGIFDGPTVTKAWSAHKAGTQDMSYQIWGLLMFQSWHDHWMKK